MPLPVLDAKLLLKSTYAFDVHRWGVLALPRQQSGAAALTHYRDEDLVLLVLASHRHDQMHGRIFGACTLRRSPHATLYRVNPDVLREWPDLDRWPTCLPVERCWRFQVARHYNDFRAGGLARRIGQLKGKLGTLAASSELEEEIREWLALASAQELPVWREVGSPALV